MQVSQNLCVRIIFLLPVPLQHCKQAKSAVLKSKVTEHGNIEFGNHAYT